MSGRGRRGSGLTPDEAYLWSHVTETVHPLRRPGPERIPEPGSEGARVSTPTQPIKPRDPAPDIERLGTPSGKPRWQPLNMQPSPRPKSASPAAPAFDRKQARKIASGKVEIEGRLDLHGLTEQDAHVRLRGFLRQAQVQGKRTVLVITGKGRDEGDPYAPFDFGHERAPRGVLKRNVPRWLAGPDVAPMVVSYTTAHTRHGGEGALYVHLRKA